MYQSRERAFTLVELIVVITILAILGTIGFISLLGFQKSARDSARISDINTIARALEFFRTQEWYYPNPSNSFDVTFSWSLAWKQWTFGKDTQKLTRRISKVPVDPLTGNEYTYSTTNTRQEYELWFISENNLSYASPNVSQSTPSQSYADMYSLASQTYAANNFYTNIKGNYNKQIVTVRETDRIYILWVPTIITSEINSVTVQDILSNGTFAYRNGKNLPWSYSGSLWEWQTIRDTSFNFTEWSLVATTAPVLYEWNVQALSDTNTRQQFADNLISYYQESNLDQDNLWWQARLFATETSTSENALSYVETLIRTDVWGLPSWEIDIPDTPASSCPKVTKIFGNLWAYAALRSDGSVLTWGSENAGWNSSSVADKLTSWVVSISVNDYAFAAIKDDGSVVSWWYVWDPSMLESLSGALSSDVVKVFPDEEFKFNFTTKYAFAALKNDGSVVTWWDAGWDSSSVSGALSSGVVDIVWTYVSFTARKSDGSVVAWWHPWYAWNSFSRVSWLLGSWAIDIAWTFNAFTVLKDDGSIVAWWEPATTWDGNNIPSSINSWINKVYANLWTYAFFRNDDSIHIWWGWSSLVTFTWSLASDVKEVTSSNGAFAFLKHGGGVVSYWADASSVSWSLSSGVQKVFTDLDSFAALKNDGSVVTWWGGAWDSSSVSWALLGGVIDITPGLWTYAALKSDGSVVTWWSPGSGWDSSGVVGIDSGVQKIFSNPYSFAALKNDGSIVSWWIAGRWGDSSSIQSQLSCN